MALKGYLFTPKSTIGYYRLVIATSKKSARETIFDMHNFNSKIETLDKNNFEISSISVTQIARNNGNKIETVEYIDAEGKVTEKIRKYLHLQKRKYVEVTFANDAMTQKELKKVFERMRGEVHNG